jgi:soluble lytic murein transglycosylase-like protein
VPESTLRWLARQRNRQSSFDPIIERYAEAYGVDPVLVRAVIQVESNFNPSTVSHKGARGLMQLMPDTARRFRVNRIHDPEQNIRGGVAYLAHLHTLYPYDLHLVLASYNAGENAVARYRGVPPYRETQEYVQKALTVYNGRPWGAGSITVRAKKGTPGLGGGFRQDPPQLPPYAGVAATVRTLSR